MKKHINTFFYAMKSHKKIYQSLCLCVSVVMILSACAKVPGPAFTPTLRQAVTAAGLVSPTPRPATATATSKAAATSTPLPPAASPTDVPATQTATPVSSPTQDTRLLPSQWKQWLVIPTLTGTGLEIYRKGLALGNDPHAFSKVADCQGIREVLLGAYDLPGYYTLSSENAGLQDTIDWFRGSFNRNGQATMGGFNARAVLQPQFADPAACLPGETPVECEYRVHRPSIVLISLEFGYDGRTTQNYTAYMRQIIDFYISKGVLPILATKADNFEGDNSLNLATATLAYEYDLPLWNWWLAAQPLPNHGLDPTRPDHFHISVDAWRVRSATALEAIDAVWKGVRAIANTPLAGQETRPTPAPTASPTPGANPPVLDPQAVKLLTSGHALFGLAQRKGEGYEYLGVYALDPNPKGPQLQPVLGAGWNLQAVAPDGKSMLANRGSELWYIPLDGSMIVTEQNKPVLYVLSPGDRPWLRVTPEQNNPMELFPVQDSSKIFWLDKSCGAQACMFGEVNLSGTDSLSSGKQAPVQALPGVIRPALSSDGSSFAYTYLDETERAALAVTTLDRTKIWSPLTTENGYAMDYAWSPSGRWLAALSLERSDYSGRPGVLHGYLLNPATLDKVELPAMSGLSPRLAWSADGKFLLVAATENLNVRNIDMDKGYRLGLYLVNAGTGQSSLLDGKISPAGQDYIFVTNMQWLP